MALVLNGNGTISGANLNIDSDGAATFAGLTVDTNTLHVDAVNNRVGIGTSSPGRPLDVTGSIRFSSGGVIEVGGAGGLNTYIAGIEGVSGYWALGVNGGERLRVDAAGRVTKPNQPSFFARMPAGEVALASGLTLLTSTHLGAVDYNVGGHYNTSTATFTAPISGLYHFDIGVYTYPVSQCDVYVQVNNADFHRFHSQPFPSAVNPNGTRGSTNFALAANDTVRIVLAVSASCGLWNGGPRATYFSGYLIG